MKNVAGVLLHRSFADDDLGRAADPASRDKALSTWANSSKDGRHVGIARPSNVIECKTESSQCSHSAPFPRALVEFFAKAFTDKGDVVFDPFMGSGTTIAAAEVLDRIGYPASDIEQRIAEYTLRREQARQAAQDATDDAIEAARQSVWSAIGNSLKTAFRRRSRR